MGFLYQGLLQFAMLRLFGACRRAALADLLFEAVVNGKAYAGVAMNQEAYAPPAAQQQGRAGNSSHGYPFGGLKGNQRETNNFVGSPYRGTYPICQCFDFAAWFGIRPQVMIVLLRKSRVPSFFLAYPARSSLTLLESLFVNFGLIPFPRSLSRTSIVPSGTLLLLLPLLSRSWPC